MRFSIVSMIQSVLEFRFIRAIPHSRLNGDSSYFPGNISSPFFSAKNALVAAYLLESFLARFKNLVCCFQTISCLLIFKEGNEWISSAACLFPALWKRTKSSQMYWPEKFRVSGIKSSHVVTKETSQMLLQTPWHLWKPQKKNLVSL